MTLRRKMALQIGAAIVGLAMLSAASLWGIIGLHQDFGAALAGYQELRELHEASGYIQTARTLVLLAPLGKRSAIEQVRLAQQTFERHWPIGRPGTPMIRPEIQERFRRSIQSGLARALTELELADADRTTYHPQSEAAPLEAVLDQFAMLSDEIRRAIEQHQADADARRRGTLAVMALMALIVIAGAVALGLWQYRGVTRPLERLRDGVRRIAAGRFEDRLSPEGAAEFADLASDFNRMAGELQELYRDLEQKVAAKSSELVRSERLASVGFLAAGVAHEINNPIGIIAGYAELSLARLREQPHGDAAEARKALEVICEEAFRCKQIVQKLLALARPGDEARGTVSMSAIARDVISMVGGLSTWRDRRIELETEKDERTCVMANAAEMKQVVLNLVLNALEATSAGGRVRLTVAQRDDLVELSVEDNGRGMDSQVLARVFEPFFTAKRGASSPGTGLGLSITHAIVQNHGGSIRAHSDGPGKGSRFVVQLPAAGERS
jgi:two-component system NtrC family sensor kinase